MPDPIEHVGKLKLYPSARTSAEWNMVDPAVKATSFFSACVEDERVLSGLQSVVQQAMEEGMSMQDFVDEALSMLDFIRIVPPDEEEEKKRFKFSIDTLYNPKRLRLIYRTQEQLAHGYKAFCEAFDPDWLDMFPAWEFVRQPGAVESQKRPDHVKHEGAIELKTNLQFWLDRNSFDQGGFGNPYGPWGFNSWMRTFDVDRETAEALGLIAPGEAVQVPAELGEWNLPNMLKQAGSTSTKELDDAALESIWRKCEEAGIGVEWQADAEVMSIAPTKGSALGKLSSDTFDAWMNEDLSKLFE
jgi:hypothetical protein